MLTLDRIKFLLQLSLATYFFTPSFGFTQNAKNECLPYVMSGNLMVGMIPADDDLLKKTVTELRNFIGTAKQNPARAVDYFSKDDGSFADVANKIANTPDYFGGYQTIGDVTINEGFLWGNYLLFNAKYSIGNDSFNMLEAFYCANKSCKKSTFLERDTETISFANQWLSLKTHAKTGITQCPTNKETTSFNIWVDEGKTDINPITVYIDSKYIARNYKINGKSDFLRQVLPKSCAEQIIKGIPLKTGDQAAVKSYLDTVAEKCALNASAGSLMPVIEFDGKTFNKKYVVAEVFIDGLTHIDQADLLYVFQDKQIKTYIFLIKLDTGRRVVVALPINAELSKLDWRYFSTAPGTLFSGSLIAEQIKENHPGIFGLK